MKNKDLLGLYCLAEKFQLKAKVFITHQSIENIIKLYTAVTKAYTRDINETNIIDYNKMIKQPVNYKSLGKQRDILKDVI